MGRGLTAFGPNENQKQSFTPRSNHGISIDFTRTSNGPFITLTATGVPIIPASLRNLIPHQELG
jgi:hypothetical protein